MTIPYSPFYWPRGKLERIGFIRNFMNMIGEHGPPCGIGAEEAASCRTDLGSYLALLEVLNPAAADFKERVADYTENIARGDSSDPLPYPVFPNSKKCPEQPLPGVLKRLFALIARIMVAPGYNEKTIGKDLKLLREVTVPVERAAPEPPTLGIIPGDDHQVVEIGFRKLGHDGVTIECRRNGGPWESLGPDNAKPHYDNRPLLVPGVPETREYRLRWWDKGTAHGEWSESRSISVNR